MDAKRAWRLIGDVYDAALDPSRWTDTLGDAAAFVGGSSAALYWKDAARKTGGVHREDGRMDLAYQKLYFEKYAALDPATHTHVFAAIDEPIATADFSTIEEYRDTRIYREWIRPQGIVDAVNTVLDKTSTGAGMFIVFRSESDGIVDDETRGRMRLLAPHVRRAVNVARAMESRVAETATYTDALDGLSAGLFFVDPDGAIVHANSAGHATPRGRRPLADPRRAARGVEPGGRHRFQEHFPSSAFGRRAGRNQRHLRPARHNCRKSTACDARPAADLRRSAQDRLG